MSLISLVPGRSEEGERERERRLGMNTSSINRE
jgi:hypothetical protein